MPEIFLLSFSRALLVVHAVVGFATVATTTHLAVTTLRRHRPRLRLYAWLAAGFAGLQWILGAAIYPAFRVQVRGYLEENVRIAVTIFEFKEHAALAAVALLAVCVLVTRTSERAPKWLLPALTIIAACGMWSAALAGLWVSAIRAVGSLS